jgi:hypothetical protein
MASYDRTINLERSCRRGGQTFLSLVFLIGALIASVAITFVFLALSFAASGYAFQASNAAEFVAVGGVEDALLQLDRNPVFASSYALPVASSTANVVVTQDAPSVGYVSILSTAAVSGATRKISVVAARNATSGEIDVVSWQLIQ